MSFAERHHRKLPSGIYFVKSLDQQLRRKGDSERNKKHKTDKIEYNKVRRTDPVKRSRDQETKNLNGSTQRGKDSKRQSTSAKSTTY